MRLTALIAATVICTACTAQSAQSTKESKMIDGLTRAYATTCGAVGLELWYSPKAELAYLRDDDVEDVYKYRIVFAVTNTAPPADRRVSFTAPKPLGNFVQLFRQTGDQMREITHSQVDPRHAGQPEPTHLRFEGVGEVWYSSLAYPALTTIANPADLIAGDYVIRIRDYAMIEADGQACTIHLPDLKVRVR